MEPAYQDICWEIVPSRYGWKAAPMKSQKYHYLNKSHTIMMPVDISVWTREISQDPICKCRAMGNLMATKRGRFYLLRGESLINDPSGQP